MKTLTAIIFSLVLTVQSMPFGYAFDMSHHRDHDMSPVDKAIAAVGGETALTNLSGFEMKARGLRWTLDEGFVAGEGSTEEARGSFDVQLTYDVEGDNLRLDYEIAAAGFERVVSEIINGSLGVMDGQNSNFGAPQVTDMLSDRWASIRKHQRLLNPHLILQDILEDPTIVTDGGMVMDRRRHHHVLTVEDGVVPLKLVIHARSGRLLKITTIESDELRRDVPLEIWFGAWRHVGDGLRFPRLAVVFYDREIVQLELRTQIEVNPEIDPELFELPDDASPEFDEELAIRGDVSHQYLQSFAALGFPRDGVQPFVDATLLAPGIYHVTGGSHHSLAVEQDDGVVIVEAPLDDIRSLAVIDWAADTFPDKDITHAVMSHHHADHSAGLRTYVAEGATTVMHENAVEFFEHIFDAPSEIVPDSLEENPFEATIEPVPADGSTVLQSTMNPVSVYPIAGGHAEDLVIVEAGGIVFVVDLYTPFPGAPALPPGGLVLADRIEELGLEVEAIAGGHGGVISFEEFRGLADQE